MKTWWWQDIPTERYWCEITDRLDIGADLNCPQQDESGKPYWSYSLIREVWPGDIVFYYSTRDKGFVGASVAGGPLEEQATRWMPHGTVGRSKTEERDPRPGWRLPLYGFHLARQPLLLESLQSEAEQTWVRNWITERKSSGSVAAPLQLYPRRLRAAQGYLTKMPADFVERWEPLTRLAEHLSDRQDELDTLGEYYPPEPKPKKTGFKPKQEGDYEAVVRGGKQRRTRHHERLVREAGEYLASYVSLLEADKRRPQEKTLVKLAEALGVPMDVLRLLATEREDLGRLSPMQVHTLASDLIKVLAETSE